MRSCFSQCDNTLAGITSLGRRLDSRFLIPSSFPPFPLKKTRNPNANASNDNHQPQHPNLTNTSIPPGAAGGAIAIPPEHGGTTTKPPNNHKKKNDTQPQKNTTTQKQEQHQRYTRNRKTGPEKPMPELSTGTIIAATIGATTATITIISLIMNLRAGIKARRTQIFLQLLDKLYTDTTAQQTLSLIYNNQLTFNTNDNKIHTNTNTTNNDLTTDNPTDNTKDVTNDIDQLLNRFQILGLLHNEKSLATKHLASITYELIKTGRNNAIRAYFQYLNTTYQAKSGILHDHFKAYKELYKQLEKDKTQRATFKPCEYDRHAAQQAITTAQKTTTPEHAEEPTTRTPARNEETPDHSTNTNKQPTKTENATLNPTHDNAATNDHQPTNIQDTTPPDNPRTPPEKVDQNDPTTLRNTDEQQPPTISIRQATTQDLDGIMRIEQSVEPPPLGATPTTITARLHTFPQGCLVATTNNDITGYVTSIRWNNPPFTTFEEINDFPSQHDEQGTTLYIIYLATHPDHQRQGIATALLDHLTTTARTLGIQQLQLVAKPHLENFYEHRGFHRKRILNNFLPTTPGHLMEQELINTP